MRMKPRTMFLCLCVVMLTLPELALTSYIVCPLTKRLPLWLPRTNGHDPSKCYYNVIPNKFGVEIQGVDLATESRPEVIERLRRDVIKHQLLLFRNQSVEPSRHLRVGGWFEDPYRAIRPHSKQEHRFLMRVSNNEQEGATGSGGRNWHVDTDGIYPATHILFHTIQAPRDGPTRFMPLDKVVEGLSNETLRRWERLWFVEQEGVLPTVCLHPVTAKKTLILRLRYLDYFLWNFATDNERPTRKYETDILKREITDEIEKHRDTHVYEHMWRTGDFVIVDNRAVAHMPSPIAHKRETIIGLRLIRRMVVGGRTEPMTGNSRDNPAQRALPIEPWHIW